MDAPRRAFKNERAHTLPLMPMARDIINRAAHGEPRSVVWRARQRGFTAWAKARQALDQRAKVSDWVLHDIRRTLSTRLHDLGVAPHVVEQILNHQGHRGQVGGTYNKSAYEREVRAALALWEDHVRTLVQGGERKVLAWPAASLKPTSGRASIFITSGQLRPYPGMLPDSAHEPTQRSRTRGQPV